MAFTTTANDHTHRRTAPPRRRRTHPIAGVLAALWAVLHVAIAILHLAGRGPTPWTPIEASVLGSLRPATAATGLAVLALLALATLTVTTVTARRTSAPAGVHRGAGAVLVAVGLVAALGFGDMRGLALMGYLPMVLLSLLGVGPVADLDPAVLASPMLSLSHTVGGLALVLTGVSVLSAGREGTGRATAAAPRRAAAALRVGRWAVGVAVTVPVGYATTRIAWAVGLPLGVRDAFLVELGSAKFAGLGLGLFALVGCLLTLGLVQRWGERFWRWVPRIGGRPVPVSMAVVPALFVATAVTSAGLGFWRSVVMGDLDRLPGEPADWAAWAPELLWPLWGLALGVAALAYRARREATAERP